MRGVNAKKPFRSSTRARAFPRHNLPGFWSNRRPQEARGRRECQVFGTPAAARAVVESTRVSHCKYAETIRHPCAMVYGLRRSPRCTGLCSHRRQKRNWFRPRLDPSVGGPGPHAFAVREAAFVGAHKRAQQPHGHRIPPPTSVTIASRPSRGSRMQGGKHEFRKNGRGIFLRRGLDRGDGVGIVGENRGFGAADLIRTFVNECYGMNHLLRSPIRRGLSRDDA